MNYARRTVLITTAGLSGCLGTLQSNARSGPIETEKANGDETSTPGELRWALEGQLHVTEMHWQGETMHLTYQSGKAGESDEQIDHNPQQEITFVIENFADHIEYGGTATRLEVTVLDDFGEPAVTYFVKRSWAETFNRGDVTSRQYFVKVYQTTQAVK